MLLCLSLRDIRSSAMATSAWSASLGVALFLLDEEVEDSAEEVEVVEEVEEEDGSSLEELVVERKRSRRAERRFRATLREGR